MRTSLSAAAIGWCTVASIAAAQATYPVKKCAAPNEPLGILHAQGQVAYRLMKDGRPDTGSVRVVSVRGISPGGLRSAAVRELSACRFDRSADSAAAVFVVDAIGFDSATVIVSPATVVAETIIAMALPARPAFILEPVDANDSTVEERPRRLGCDRTVDQPPFTGAFRTRQDAEAAQAAWRRQNSGVMIARVTVTSDGTIHRDGIAVTSTTNPMMMDEFFRVLLSCRYVPGRIGGMAIPTIVATRTGIGNPGGP